jgi:hypothetical protein
MTSIEHIKNANDNSLFRFLNGHRAEAYVVPEEKGFHTTGNIGALLNSSPGFLNQIKDGIIVNNRNLTDHSETFIGRIHPMKNDWRPLERAQPQTPLIYCDEQPLSQLLPFYPNTATLENPQGIPNVLLNPNCNLELGGVAAPQLYGGTSAFVNNKDVLNNPDNDIGHELQPYGIALGNGLRGLSQGKHSCEILGAGLNVPNLRTHTNKNGAYIASPRTMAPHIPLYQVGDWTNEVSGNFLQEFNNNVGQGCQGPSPPSPPGPRPRPGPSGRGFRPTPVGQ